MAIPLVACSPTEEEFPTHVNICLQIENSVTGTASQIRLHIEPGDHDRTFDTPAGFDKDTDAGLTLAWESEQTGQVSLTAAAVDGGTTLAEACAEWDVQAPPLEGSYLGLCLKPPPNTSSPCPAPASCVAGQTVSCPFPSN